MLLEDDLEFPFILSSSPTPELGIKLRASSMLSKHYQLNPKGFLLGRFPNSARGTASEPAEECKLRGLGAGIAKGTEGRAEGIVRGRTRK